MDRREKRKDYDINSIEMIMYYFLKFKTSNLIKIRSGEHRTDFKKYDEPFYSKQYKLHENQLKSHKNYEDHDEMKYDQPDEYKRRDSPLRKEYQKEKYDDNKMIDQEKYNRKLNDHNSSKKKYDPKGNETKPTDNHSSSFNVDNLKDSYAERTRAFFLKLRSSAPETLDEPDKSPLHIEPRLNMTQQIINSHNILDSNNDQLSLNQLFVDIYLKTPSIFSKIQDQTESKSIVDPIIKALKNSESLQQEYNQLHNKNKSIESKYIDDEIKFLHKYADYKLADRKVRIIESDIYQNQNIFQALNTEEGEWPESSWNLAPFTNFINHGLNYDDKQDDVE